MAINMSTSYRIKKVDTWDPQFLEEMVLMEKEVFPEGYLDEWGLASLITYGAVYLLYFGQEKAGLAEFMGDWNDPQKVYLYGFFVKEEYQGEGIGTDFLSDVLNRVKEEEGKERVELSVDPFNEAACYLYMNKMGFTIHDYKEDYYGLGEDRLILSLEL